MPDFFINNGNNTAQNSQFFNGFDNYAAGTRENVPNIAAGLQGQSTAGPRNIVMVYQLGLRLAGGTYLSSTRPWIGCFRIWNNTEPTSGGASAASLSASSQFSIAAFGADGTTTKPLTIRDMPDVILDGGSTYLFGFNNANTTTAIWAGVSCRTGISPSQNVFQDTLSSTPNDDPFVLDTTSGADPGILTVATTTIVSIMGQVYYYTIPPAPVITSITKLTNGVTINFTVDETTSFTTTGCKAYFSLNNVTFTQATGTFGGSGGSYTYQITSPAASPALTLGQTYYFEVCALNAVTSLDIANNPGYDTRSLDSNSVQQQYGQANFIKVRNALNTAWVNATLSVRNALNTAWIQGTAKVRNSTNTDWINNY